MYMYMYICVPGSSDSPGSCRLARSSSVTHWAWSIVVKHMLYSWIIDGYSELKSKSKINLDKCTNRERQG